MKIREAITRTDDAKFNTYSDMDKVAWLSKLDGMIKVNILDLCEGPEVTFRGYDPDYDMETMLLVPPPFDEMYLRWLEAQIDRANNEEEYNASILLFNAEYDAFEKYFIRTHRPKNAGKRFLF